MRYAVQARMEDGTESQRFGAGTEATVELIVGQIMERQADLGRRCTCKVYDSGKLARVITMKKWREAKGS